MGKLKILGDVVEGGLNAIKSAGRAAHEEQAAVRAARDAEVAEQMANLPARNKKANEALGLYHPVGGGIKLSKPTSGMHSTKVADPKFKPPKIADITPEQLVKEEAALFPLVGDRAAAGKYLTHVGENELETPVRLTGGPRYMDANYNFIDPEQSAAWESGLGRVTALSRQAERAGEGGRPVYGIYTAGSGTNTDFNVMGANALLQQIPHSKITKKAEREFDRAMREGSKAFPPIPDWPGIRSPEAQDLILDKSNGIARTKLFDTMGKENFQSMGFPDVPATRKAIIEPELLDIPTNEAGFRLARMDTKGRIIEDPNIPSDYPTAMAGKVAGKLDVPADYKDVFQSHFDARRLLGQPESGDYYSFSRAHPIQYADDAWLNRLMEQRFANERKIKEGEYKKGGAVHDFDSPDASMRVKAKIAEHSGGGKVEHHWDDPHAVERFHRKMAVHKATGGVLMQTPSLRKKAGGGLLTKGAKALAGAMKGAEVIPAAEKVIVQQAPSIIIPSKVSNVKEAIRQSKGDYGARRVERAADEIPNLEKLYKEQALIDAFGGDNAKALMTMKPKDFEKYAAPLDARFMDEHSTRYTTGGERLPYPEYMSEYLPNVGAFNDVPFLVINKQEQGLPLMPFISGHEGRHRNRVMAGKGEESGLVILSPRSELREPFPRKHQDQYINALKEELDMTGNKVVPEKYFDNFEQKDIKRPAIDLPDIYAKGGAILKHTSLRNRKPTQAQPIRLAEGGITLARTSLRRMKDGGKPEATVQATPRSKGYGAASDLLKEVHEFASKPFGYSNPPVEFISELLGIPAASRVLDKLSYGEPITNYGKANVPLIPDDTFDAFTAGLGGLGSMSKLAKPLAKGLKMLPKNLPVGMSIKAVGEDVMPLVKRDANKAKFLESSKVKQPVYHGTMSDDIKEFRTPAYFGSKDVANQFADPEYLTGSSMLFAGEQPNVIPVHLNLKNPKVFTKESDYEKHVMEGGLNADRWKSKGHDGVIYAPDGDMASPEAYFVAFEPEQIKSAIGNRGTYSATEKDITKAKGGTILKHTTLRNRRANHQAR
jgi:hypothetical protein